MLLGGLRRRHEFAAAAAGIPEQWRQFQAKGELPGQIGSTLYGVMCGHDATGLEYMCAAEVESLAGLPEGTGKMRVPAQHYAVFTHPGDASTLQSTWEQILEWLESGDYRSAETPDFERYAGGSIEVWVGVVPA